MDDGSLIALVNPAISFSFACAFLVVSLYRRQYRYVRLIAAAFAATGIGFVLQRFGLPLGSTASKLMADAAFVVAAYVMAAALTRRYQRPVPHLPLAAISVAALAGVSWFFFVRPDLSWRVMSMSVGIGALCGVIAMELRTVPQRSLIDRMLFVTAALVSANFLFRPPLIFLRYGRIDTYDALYQSTYWTSTLLSHALLSVIGGLFLLSAIAFDILHSLMEESQTDPLSGLLNRRGFEQCGRALMEDARRSRLPLCIALADLDHFKTINDRSGHAAGDAVIAAFGRLLRHSTPRHAAVGRIGGEEFAILLPVCDLPTARLYAESVRVALSNGQAPGMPAGVERVTASFGVARALPDEALEALLRRADIALYGAKRAGRNCVRLAGGDAGDAVGSLDGEAGAGRLAQAQH